MTRNLRLFMFLGLFLAWTGAVALQAQSTKTIYLSGTGFNDPVEWDFYCTAGMNSGEWTTIQVPACWEQEGFGQYTYLSRRVEGRALQIELTFDFRGQDIRSN